MDGHMVNRNPMNALLDLPTELQGEAMSACFIASMKSIHCRHRNGLSCLALSLLLAFAPLPAQSASLAPLASRSDLLFLDRITYGVNAATLHAYRASGRARFLENQLVFHGDDGLPPEVRGRIAELDISRLGPADLLAERRAAEQQMKNAPDAETRGKLRQAINQRANDLAYQAEERRILRALYSSNQLQELLTWFWFNHFNVFQHKGNINLLVADYEENAIRPHVLGKFRDLLLATLTHPAMLVYLDNTQNASGAINENYAREIMELHTLGIDGGYTQKDVQELARILTGVGVDFSGKGCRGGETALDPAHPRLSSGLFCFDPKRHDSGSKVFLGRQFPTGGGREEVLRAVDMLAKSPATARFISSELAVYFLGDNPPDGMVRDMARTFMKSGGDIALTLGTLFHCATFLNGLGTKYKDPVQYVFSSVRLLYGDAPIRNLRPVVNWINQLGEPFYAHVAPNGYGMRGNNWLSADQMARRFDVARNIYWSAGVLYSDEPAAGALDNADQKRLQALRRRAREAHPVDSFGNYDLVRTMLSDRTLGALKKTLTLDEWNSLLLSSSEFMYR